MHPSPLKERRAIEVVLLGQCSRTAAQKTAWPITTFREAGGQMGTGRPTASVVPTYAWSRAYVAAASRLLPQAEDRATQLRAGNSRNGAGHWACNGTVVPPLSTFRRNVFCRLGQVHNLELLPRNLEQAIDVLLSLGLFVEVVHLRLHVLTTSDSRIVIGVIRDSP